MEPRPLSSFFVFSLFPFLLYPFVIVSFFSFPFNVVFSSPVPRFKKDLYTSRKSTGSGLLTPGGQALKRVFEAVQFSWNPRLCSCCGTNLKEEGEPTKKEKLKFFLFSRLLLRAALCPAFVERREKHNNLGLRL